MNAPTFFYKISKRFEDDISSVCLALYIESQDNVITVARTGFGGMAATPVSAPSVEAQLIGHTYCQQSFEQAAKSVSKDMQPMTDVRASKKYRLSVTENLIRRAWFESSQCEQDVVVRVSHA